MQPMPALRLALLATTVLLNSLASAQTTTYSWVDPKTGTTVISDQQPPPGAKQIFRRESDDGGTGAEPQIPYATRQAAEKFPVTLYTATNCTDPCTQARGLLNSRGIPFSEKILQSQEDIDALGKLLGSAATTPTLIVGRQNFKGFEAGAWTSLLDLAGYPKTAPYGARPSGVGAR